MLSRSPCQSIITHAKKNTKWVHEYAPAYVSPITLFSVLKISHQGEDVVIGAGAVILEHPGLSSHGGAGGSTWKSSWLHVVWPTGALGHSPICPHTCAILNADFAEFVTRTADGNQVCRLLLCLVATRGRDQGAAAVPAWVGRG